MLINKILPEAQERKITLDAFPISTQQLAIFLELIQSDQVSTAIAYQKLFPALLEQPTKSPQELAEKMELIQSNDEDFLRELIGNILTQNSDKVKAYQNGKKNLLGFFMGQVMRQSKGKANPKSAETLLKEQLEG